MDPLLQKTLVKVALPAAGIAMILLGARRRGMSWRDDLGLAPPRAKHASIWLTVWIAWMATTELLAPVLGVDAPKAWDYPALVTGLRILAIGVLGPVVEELVMRGAAFHVLSRRIGVPRTIVVTAAVFAAIHFQYGPATLGVIFVDGVLYGLARHQTRSLWVPIAMHVLGNLFSIWQSLSV